MHRINQGEEHPLRIVRVFQQQIPTLSVITGLLLHSLFVKECDNEHCGVGLMKKTIQVYVLLTKWFP